ncbi:hypothetical protein ASZ90_010429 [hydrocarbon metagenome]|uniref:Uncharacterized protein n=1 Tax=hydrocarbon metagenome TaxID=938273 RepID=A0A0W8FG34_9ZZZZ
MGSIFTGAEEGVSPSPVSPHYDAPHGQLQQNRRERDPDPGCPYPMHRDLYQ